MNLSVVIIVSKNDAAGTEATLKSIQPIAGEMVLYDVSKTDFSEKAAIRFGARVYHGVWNGYDHVRSSAAEKATHDWVLMLHTGEVVDEVLCEAIRQIDIAGIDKAYRMQFKNFFRGKWLRHGEWGNEWHIRMANKKRIQIPDSGINESLIISQGVCIENLEGFILHNTVKDKKELAWKMKREAFFAAAKYHLQGKKAARIKMIVSPVAAFIKNYFFKLGILDGAKGLVFSRFYAWYHFIKYARLRQLNKMIKTPL